MKKLLGAVFAGAVTIASGAFADDIVIGLSVDQLFESRVGVNNAIHAEAEDRGFEVIEVVADGDAQAQNAQIQSLIAQEVDAILVCAVDQNTIERALIAAQRAGIPVVAYDRDLPESRVVQAFVGPDSLFDGREAGRYMAEALSGVEGEVVLVELIGALNDQNGIDRSAGWREEIAALENVRIIEVPTDWDSSRALSGTQNAFQQSENIHGVFAATDTHIPAVETVLTDLGRLVPIGEEGHVVVTGINGSNDGYTATAAGTADGIVVMDLDTTGRTAVALAVELMAGNEVPRTNVIPGNFYTHDNIEENAAMIWGAP